MSHSATCLRSLVLNLSIWQHKIRLAILLIVWDVNALYLFVAVLAYRMHAKIIHMRPDQQFDHMIQRDSDCYMHI
jgi:hypothetical protein